MDPLPPPIPPFTDVLEMVKRIPDESQVTRVTMWAKQKYSSEMQLEAKVEKLEKKLVNCEFKSQNLETTLKTLRAQNDQRDNAQVTELERRVKEQKKQLKDLQNLKIHLKSQVVQKEEFLMDALKRSEEKDRVIEQKNKKIYEMMDKVTDLQKQTSFYEEEITKLLDEKEDRLNEVVEASDIDSEFEDSDSDNSSDSSSDSSDSEDEKTEDQFNFVEEKRYRIDVGQTKELELLKSQLEVAEMLLAQANKDLHVSQMQKSSVTKTLNSKLATAKRTAEETEEKAEVRCRVLANKIKKMQAEFAEDLKIESDEKRKALFKLSEEMKKAKERSDRKAAEITFLQKTIVDLQASHQTKMDEANSLHRKLVRDLTDEIRSLDATMHYIKNTNSLKIEELQKEYQDQLNSQSNLIDKLRESEKEQSEKLIVSQDKLVLQMEKNMKLQDDVMGLTKIIQNLGVEEIDDDVSSVGAEEKVTDNTIEVGQEPEIDTGDIDYNSDSSFEPVDEVEL